MRQRGAVRWGLVVVVAATLCTVAFGARAQIPQEVVVRVGKTVTVNLPRRPQRLSAENPSIASVTVAGNGTAKVTGHKVGTTRLVGRDDAQVPILISVRVVK